MQHGSRGLRRALIRAGEAVDDWLLAARADLFPLHAYDVQRFEAPADMERFQVTTDKVLGASGATEAQFALKSYAHFSSGVFSGAIDYRDDNPQSRGGFAAFRTRADERERDLSQFGALEMRIKTDGRPYVLNLKASHQSPDFLWQIRLLTEAHRWTTVAFPFSDMILTKRGRIEMTQHPVERERVAGWGVLLADCANGPFRFEIQYLRAVRALRPEEHLTAADMALAAASPASSASAMSGPAALAEPPRRLPEGGDAAAAGAGGGAAAAAAAPATPEAAAAAAAATATAAAAPGARDMGRDELRAFYRDQRERARLK